MRSPSPHRSPPASAATLFYDADCGFCKWALSKVAAWDRHGALRLVPLQDAAEADRLLGDMPGQVRMASWHLVDADNTVHSAGRGIGPLLRLLPAGAGLARVVEGVQPLTSAAYVFVASHRSAFGRLVSRNARLRAEHRIRQHRSRT